ncbi:hypothetical protein GCM10023212_28730 [Luteolibacter yonseiensis]
MEDGAVPAHSGPAMPVPVRQVEIPIDTTNDKVGQCFMGREGVKVGVWGREPWSGETKATHELEIFGRGFNHKDFSLVGAMFDPARTPESDHDRIILPKLGFP